MRPVRNITSEERMGVGMGTPERCPRCEGKGYVSNAYYDECGRKRETRLDCDQCTPCFTCGKRVAKGTASIAMNLPGVTPGPVIFCHCCEPIGTPEEIAERIENFLRAPTERAHNKRG